MKSIRRRLTVRLLLAIAGLVLLANLLLYFRVRMALKHQYDEGLFDRAGALTHLIAWDENGKMMLEIPEKALDEFNRTVAPDYLEVWRPDGSVFFRSTGLTGKEIAAKPDAATPMFWYTELPDGRAGRATVIQFVPHLESEEPQPIPERGERVIPTPPPPGEAFLVLASDMQRVDAFLNHLLEGQIIATLLLAGFSAGAVILSIRRSLIPLEKLAAEADALPIQSLDRRFSEEDLPAELRPIVRRLNDLLGRIEAAFRRERRFTSNVAHELRTPITELRALAEVALRHAAAANQGEFEEALAIARQMQSLVESLLAIARAESLPAVERRETADLDLLIRAGLKPYQAAIAERRLRVVLAVEGGIVMTDRAILESLLRNLISNAVTYAPVDSEIVIQARVAGDHPQILVSNEAPDLSAEDLGHLAEPFWRKDAARTDGGHAGLGLSLSVAYAGMLGLKLVPAISHGLLTISVAPLKEGAAATNELHADIIS